MVSGLIVIAAWVIIAIIAAAIAPYNPLAQNVNVRLTAPNNAYPFGTDELGRDVFSRVLYGARVTMPAGIAVVVIGSIIGTIVGGVAGYLGGLWDEALMRVTELFMAFPTIILALAITAALGPDIRNAIIALVVVWWPPYARFVRGLVLEVKTQEYVTAVKSVGARGMYTLFRTIIPNCIAPAIILATLDIGPADLGNAPIVVEPSIAPDTNPLNYVSADKVQIDVEAAGTLRGVGLVALREGVFDGNVGRGVVLVDDGTNGDATAGDGTYTNSNVVHVMSQTREDDTGPRMLRVEAEVETSDGFRHATAVEFGPLTVVAS